MNPFGFFILLFSSAGPEPSLVSHCTGSPANDIVVMSFPGWDHRTWGWVQFDASPEITICNYEVGGDWSDREVTAGNADLEKFLREKKKVALVGYSMTAPFIAEMVDTSPLLRYEPERLEQVSLLMIAPAVRVRSSLRSAIKGKAQRWEHAWFVHFETRIIEQRAHDEHWNAFIDRVRVVKAERERVVDYGAISSAVEARLGNNIQVIPSSTHTSIRANPLVTEILHGML